MLDSLNIDGLLVLDDSSLYTDFNNISFEKYNIKTFKGHEGPSRIFKELLEDKSLKFLIGVGHNNVFKKLIQVVDFSFFNPWNYNIKHFR